MKPATPVIKRLKDKEIVFAKNQPEYLPLPALVSQDGMVTMRWKLTWFERLRVLIHGSVFVQLLTFGKPLQPIKVSAEPPEI